MKKRTPSLALAVAFAGVIFCGSMGPDGRLTLGPARAHADWFAKTLRNASNAIKEAAKKVGGVLQRAGKSVGAAVKQAGNKAGEWFAALKKQMGGAVENAGEWAAALPRNIFNQMKTWYSTLKGKFRDGFGWDPEEVVKRIAEAIPYIPKCTSGELRSREKITGECNGSSRFCDRPYDEVAQVMTHNSMAAFKYVVSPGAANHCDKITTQLDNGVRGLMLDTHMWLGKPWLCHRTCALGGIPLVDGLREIREWLERNPRQVVTINFENDVSGAQMLRAMIESKLVDPDPSDGDQSYLYVPPVSSAPDHWPTLRELIDSKRRLVVFTSSHGGAFPGFLDVNSFASENGYAAATERDFGCSFRSDHGPAYIFNHFLSKPFGSPPMATRANSFRSIMGHARKCWRDMGRKPTFVAVDWYEIGDVMRAVKALNAPVLERVPGRLKRIAVGNASLVFGVNSAGKVFRREQSEWLAVAFPGEAEDIGVGADGTVWAVGTNGDTYSLVESSVAVPPTLMAYEGHLWSKVKGSLRRIAVGDRRKAWAISRTGDVLRRDPGAWTKVAGKLTEIGVGKDGAVWGVNSAQQVWQWTGSWKRVKGALVSIAVGDEKNVWGVNRVGEVWRWTGSKWSKYARGIARIAAGADGTVWGVNDNGDIFRLWK